MILVNTAALPSTPSIAQTPGPNETKPVNCQYVPWASRINAPPESPRHGYKACKSMEIKRFQIINKKKTMSVINLHCDLPFHRHIIVSSWEWTIQKHINLQITPTANVSLSHRIQCDLLILFATHIMMNRIDSYVPFDITWTANI